MPPFNPVGQPQKSRHKPIKIVLLVLLIGCGLLVFGGAALVVGGLAWFGKDCNRSVQKVKQQDAAARQLLANVHFNGMDPEIRSLSNSDCIDGRRVDVIATYTYAGELDSARAAMLRAVAGRDYDTPVPQVAGDDRVFQIHFSDVEDVLTINGEKYTVTYVLARPYDCTVPRGDSVCDYRHAYEAYNLAHQSLQSVKLQYTENMVQ